MVNETERYRATTRRLNKLFWTGFWQCMRRYGNMTRAKTFQFDRWMGRCYLKNKIGEPSFLLHKSIVEDVLQQMKKFKKNSEVCYFLKAKILLRNFHTLVENLVKNLWNKTFVASFSQIWMRNEVNWYSEFLIGGKMLCQRNFLLAEVCSPWMPSS